MSVSTKKRSVPICIEDDGKNVIVKIQHGYKPKDYLKIHEETTITLDRERKASLLTHLIDVAYRRKDWVG